MRYYIIAGEASGDLHGSRLVQQIKEKDSTADIKCWGGDLMKNAGATLVKHYKDLAFMGFVEVVKHLPTIFQNISFCKKELISFKPDVLVLIDYPGFNLRIAKWAKKQGITVIYYISPQAWAWKEGRVKTIIKSVDKLLVILPFEVAFYKKWHYDAYYVGHPLVEVINDEKSKLLTEHFSEKPIIALLPGSRKQEIAIKLPIMLTAVKHFPDYQFIIAAAPAISLDFYHNLIQNAPLKIVTNNTYTLLRQSTAALVTSGTATLETALFSVPQIVCYKGNKLSYWLAKKLIKIKYISLVNLILDKPLIKELIQQELTEENLVKELRLILPEGSNRDTVIQEYNQLWQLLGTKKAAAEVADWVVNWTKNK